MAKCVHSLFLPDVKMGPARVREAYATRNLQDWELVEVVDKAAALTEIEVLVTYAEEGRRVQRSIRVRMLNEDESGTGQAAIRGKPGTAWKLGGLDIT